MCPCNEENWKPITHAALFQVWLNMAQWFRCIWECKKQTDKWTDRWCRREYQKSSHRILFKWAKKEPNQFYWMLRAILWGNLKWLYKVNDMSSKHIENMKQLEYMYQVVQFHCCHPEFDLNEANRVHTM